MTLLLTILIALVLLGLILWLIDRAPFDPMIRWAMQAVAVIAAIIWVASRAGLG